MKLPSTQELADQSLVHLEGNVAQTSPLANKAFLRVLSVMLALLLTGLYKLAGERARQNSALTATGEDLITIGLGTGRGVIPKLAEFASLTVTTPGTNGLTVPNTTTFSGDANGMTYNVSAPAIVTGGFATLTLTAASVGVAGNLQIADTLSITSPLPGVGTAATVSAIVNVGTEDETDEEYRPRVLLEERATHGGGNAADYRTWSEEVAGVVRAYPYGGKPPGAGTSYPGDRTIYIQATTSIDPDGVPTGGLLSEVRNALNVNPTTGATRPALGLIDATLYVQPIVRRLVSITVTNLVTPAGSEADVRAGINSALAQYLLLFIPYVDGVDLPQDRNDRITNPALATELQSTLSQTGSSAAGISFTIGGTDYSAYELSAGELLKLLTVFYETV